MTHLVIFLSPFAILSHLVWRITVSPATDVGLAFVINDEIHGSHHLGLAQDGRHNTSALPVVHGCDLWMTLRIHSDGHVVNPKISMIEHKPIQCQLLQPERRLWEDERDESKESLACRFETWSYEMIARERIDFASPLRDGGIDLGRHQVDTEFAGWLDRYGTGVRTPTDGTFPHLVGTELERKFVAEVPGMGTGRSVEQRRLQLLARIPQEGTLD